jgi:hypothetical protein
VFIVRFFFKEHALYRRAILVLTTGGPKLLLDQSGLGSAIAPQSLLSVAILVTNGNPLRTVWEKLSELADNGWFEIVSLRLWQNLEIDADARNAQ